MVPAWVGANLTPSTTEAGSEAAAMRGLRSSGKIPVVSAFAAADPIASAPVVTAIVASAAAPAMNHRFLRADSRCRGMSDINGSSVRLGEPYAVHLGRRWVGGGFQRVGARRLRP